MGPRCHACRCPMSALSWPALRRHVLRALHVHSAARHPRVQRLAQRLARPLTLIGFIVQLQERCSAGRTELGPPHSRVVPAIVWFFEHTRTSVAMQAVVQSEVIGSTLVSPLSWQG